MRGLRFIGLLLVAATAVYSTADAQEPGQFQVVREILNTQIFNPPPPPVEEACPGCSDEESSEITLDCCKCMENLQVMEILGVAVCMNTTWTVEVNTLAEVIADVIEEEGANVDDAEEVAEAIQQFASQAVSLSDFNVREAGPLPLYSRQRDLDRELAIKAKYNDKSRDVALGVKRDRDFIANTQVGLVEKRAGRLNEVTATQVIDRNAHTGNIKGVKSDIHKDTAIEVALVGLRPDFDESSVRDTAESFVAPFVGNILEGVVDLI